MIIIVNKMYNENNQYDKKTEPLITVKSHIIEFMSGKLKIKQ